VIIDHSYILTVVDVFPRTREGYPGLVPSIQSLRGRLPFVVFVLVLVVAVVMIGFACACIADHPGKALDRATSLVPAGMPVIEMWPLVVLLLAPALLFVAAPRRPLGRASPPLLQCFLF
jgi:hypothetical protein